MKWKKKQLPEFDAPDLIALADRATRLDNGEIFTALDTTLSNLGRYISEYRQTSETQYLGEIMLGAQGVYAMAHELSIRRGEPPTTKPTRQLKTTRPI